MDSEFNCGAETGSLRVIKVPHADKAPDISVEEVTHECAYPEDHDGAHKCLNCGIEWNPEVPC